MRPRDAPLRLWAGRGYARFIAWLQRSKLGSACESLVLEVQSGCGYSRALLYKIQLESHYCLAISSHARRKPSLIRLFVALNSSELTRLVVGVFAQTFTAHGEQIRDHIRTRPLSELLEKDRSHETVKEQTSNEGDTRY